MRKPKPSPYEKRAPKPMSARRKWTANLAVFIGAGILLVTGFSQIVAYFQIQAAEADFAKQLQELEQPSATPTLQPATPTPGPTLPPGTTPTPAPTADPNAPTPTPKPTSAPAYTLLGKLTIPRMSLDVNVVEGVTGKELAVGVGHIPYTARPGQVGNVCLAGHRRGVASHPFAHIDWLKPGDKVEYFDGKTTYTYVVTETLITQATDVWVLDPMPGVDYGMTLISCYYPLFGPTERIIVRARLEGT